MRFLLLAAAADARTATYGALALAGWCLLFMPIAALFAARFRALDKELS